MSNYTPITLIGFGIAGQLLLSYILDIVPGYKVKIIDPDFLGGDLIREYSGIHSNTMIGQKLESLARLPNNWSETISSLKARGAPEDTVLLADLITDLRKSSGRNAANCNFIYDKVSSVTWNEEAKRWLLHLESGTEHSTALICFCGGMTPRQVDYGIPIIPLSMALDTLRLARMIQKGQHIIVVGSAHSATLVLKHLNTIPDISVSCIYRGSKPFKYARDNQYDGIKKESAEIADAIEGGQYANLEFVKSDDVAAISRAVKKADWVIQASGFVPRFPVINIGNTPVIPTWDAATGLAKELPQAQAFGACVPATTTINEKAYPDISVGSFVEQMEQRWPLLKLTIQNQNLV